MRVGKNGTLLRSGPDAVSWGTVPLGTTNWLYRVRRVGGQFVVVGQNGALYTSEDGTNWAARASGTTRWLNDVTFVDGTWFVVGTQGLLLSSSNLVNWTSLSVPTIKSLYGATTYDGQLVLSGIEGIILRNQVVPRTNPVSFLAYDRLVATNSPGSTNAIVSAYELFLLGGQPDQFFEFQSCTNPGHGPLGHQRDLGDVRSLGDPLPPAHAGFNQHSAAGVLPDPAGAVSPQVPASPASESKWHGFWLAMLEKLASQGVGLGHGETPRVQDRYENMYQTGTSHHPAGDPKWPGSEAELGYVAGLEAPAPATRILSVGGPLVAPILCNLPRFAARYRA